MTSQYAGAMTAGNEAGIKAGSYVVRLGGVSGSSISGQSFAANSGRGSARERWSGSTTNSLTRFGSGVSASPRNDLSAIDISLDDRRPVQ